MPNIHTSTGSERDLDCEGVVTEVAVWEALRSQSEQGSAILIVSGLLTLEVIVYIYMEYLQYCKIAGL